MKKFAIRLTEEELAALDVLAKHDGRSRSAVVRDAFDSYLSAASQLWPASIGIFKDNDGSLTSENVDEWLQANWHPA